MVSAWGCILVSNSIEARQCYPCVISGSISKMVSVLIPTTIGGFTHLTQLMPGLANECNKKAEIIIVDNHSTDGTSNYLSNYECTIIINKTNEGFAKAHNKAAKIAQGEYLLLLNNDTVVFPGLLDQMLSTFEIDPKIGIVGCLIVKIDDYKKVQHAGVMFTPDYVPYELGLEIPGIAPGITVSDPRVKSVREVPSVTGACMMIKKDIYNNIGGFDERFINGWEDTDLALKVREAGYKIWYNGNAKIYHKHFGSINAGRFAHELENRRLYDSIWIDTGRAKKVLGDFRAG